MLELIDARAKSEGITRTAWLIEAAKDRLAKEPRDGGIVVDQIRDMRQSRELQASEPRKPSKLPAGPIPVSAPKSLCLMPRCRHSRPCPEHDGTK